MPPLLELALSCENYRALPYSGGVMDQPAGLLRKMRQVQNIYEAVKLYKRKAINLVRRQSGNASMKTCGTL